MLLSMSPSRHLEPADTLVVAICSVSVALVASRSQLAARRYVVVVCHTTALGSLFSSRLLSEVGCHSVVTEPIAFQSTVAVGI